MLINSELPLTMLSENHRLNEYDFVLFHLYKEYPEYREYYLKMRHDHPERLMILDNSAYEFFVKGGTLDYDEYFEAIVELRPDFYILPDVLMDKEETLARGFGFYSNYWLKIVKAFSFAGQSSPKPLAVAQGNSADDLFDCLLKYYEDKIRNVAIPFHNSFFKEEYDDRCANVFRSIFGVVNDDHRYALGRIQFVKNAELLLKRFDHVHLLGSHCPLEKRFHPGLIKTMDTGYPVKCAIEGYKLFEEPKKPDIIIDEFMTTELSDLQKSLIDWNINKFKSL